MCLGSRTTQSPAASNTNYFGRGPWGQDGEVRPMADITPAPNTTPSDLAGSTGSGLKIGGSGKAKSKSSTKSKSTSNTGGAISGGINY